MTFLEMVIPHLYISECKAVEVIKNLTAFQPLYALLSTTTLLSLSFDCNQYIENNLFFDEEALYFRVWALFFRCTSWSSSSAATTSSSTSSWLSQSTISGRTERDYLAVHNERIQLWLVTVVFFMAYYSLKLFGCNYDGWNCGWVQWVWIWK